MSLYRRHILSIVALFFVGSGCISFLSYGLAQRYIDNAKRERVSLLAEIVTNGLKSMMLDGRSKDEFQRFLDGFAAEDVKAVRVFSDSGLILNSTVPGEVGRLVDDYHVKAFKSLRGSSIFIHKSQGRDVYSSIKVMGNDWPCQRCHGTGDEIRAIIDLEVTQGNEESEDKGALVRMLAAWLIIAGLLSLALVILTRRQLRMPLEKVINEVGRIAGGELTARVSLSGPDELAAMAAGVNRIASELEKARKTVLQYESTETSQLEKMASIGEIAATVAHEIKNPLAGISGALQVMAEDIPDNSPRKDICNEILLEIDRLDLCVKELILFARPQEMSPVFIDTNSIVVKAAAAVQETASALGIEVTALPGTVPVTSADPGLLEKVIRDVMSYQIQLMPKGGAITLSTEYDPEKQEITIISADTGLALPDEKIRNIFRPSFSTKHAGTGLGLAISRNIIETHKGRIRVDSEPGMGNFFYIIIPVIIQDKRQ